MKISKLERLALGLGRLRLLLKGVDAPLSDPYAWTPGPQWGEGLGANRKVTTKQGGIDAFLSWVYICANLNARAVASVPLELYVSSAKQGTKWQTIKTKRVDKAQVKWLQSNQGLRRYIRKAEEVEQVTEHPFLDLMSNINPFMNRSDLFEYTTLYMDLAKESYWYVIKDGIGTPTELWPVPSQHMRPLPGKSTKDYIRAYAYERGRVQVEFGVDEIIRIAYPNLNNHLSGHSVVQGIADAVYTNTEMYAYEESLFEKKARVGGVLQSDAAVSEIEVNRMREDWAQHQAGTANAGQTAILPPGVKWARDGYTNEELSFIQGRMMIREEIAAGFDTPIAIWDKTATRANVEGAQYTHAKYGILPRLRKIEEKINEQLLPMFDDTGRLFCAFENPVPEDRAFLLQKRQVDLGSGVSTINEERSEDGKEPVDGGDEPLVSSLVVPLSQAIAEPEPIPDPLATDGTLNDEDGDKPKKPKPKPGEDTEADAEKLVSLTIAKLKEKLGLTSKGGEGSGNFGHEGRPGEVGGSGPGGGSGGGGGDSGESGGGGGGGGAWKPRMTTTEADAYCQGSKIPEPVFHGTQEYNAERISQDGFLITEPTAGGYRSNAAFGYGAYFSDDPGDKDYGPVKLEARIRVKNVFYISAGETHAVGGRLSAKMEKIRKWANVSRKDFGLNRSSIFTKYCKEHGYDALSIDVGDNSHYIVVFDKNNIVVTGKE